MNDGRVPPITLRYFQYLAALYTEIYLDRYHRSPAALLDSLNKHVGKINSGHRAGGRVEKFQESDLRKLAFWMATGSGKTLLMHLNYRQFLHYYREHLDNILLITPNEGLTRQHLDELEASRIPARGFDQDEAGLFGQEADAVLVIDIHKLVSEKRGQGVTVPVEFFEGYNLIFVDEGHKGSGGEAWREVRDKLGEEGFTFEYSATFGQALTAARNDALTAEYGKAIAFDYSYRFFYDDGYGKDFHIINLQQETTTTHADTLLLANLLSFYEQQLVFADQSTELRPYNLEQPLWLFVGSSVTTLRSDVLTVARFFHRMLSEAAWATKMIGRLLDGNSGLFDEYGYDVFKGKYPYLRNGGSTSASVIYQDMLARTLHTPSGGGLHIADIRGSKGELGLKASGSDDYFGLIYIGDTSAFKKLVTNAEPGITVEEDAISGSVFAEIDKADTTIEVLIGSRKFIEGWNSWRVSNMGLLNIGQNEGSQIIQLFGRGVRLRGRNMTLKRSSALAVEENHPEQIGLLETLNIFAVRANYMAQFRDYLEREGVPTEEPLQMSFCIRPNTEFLNKGLVIPRVDSERDFKSETQVVLEYDDRIPPVYMDVSARVLSLESEQSGVDEARASSGETTKIPPESLALVDWNKTYLSLITHKEQNGMHNLVVRPDALKNIMKADPCVYQLIAEESLARPANIEEWKRLQDTVSGILRQYADKFYRRSRERWESAHMIYKDLDETDANFRFNANLSDGRGRYVVGVPRTDQGLIEEIEALIADCRALYECESASLPRIYFDRHLYQPLLVDNAGKQLKMSTPGLTESEQRFVKDLKEYWDEKKAERLADVEIYLLRNQSRGSGVGFFEGSGFYPDFILWVKEGGSQRIIFVEPHGMIYENAPEYSDKINLHEKLKQLSKKMSGQPALDNVTLDSYIISETGFETLRKRWPCHQSRSDFANAHVLFPERNDEYDYLTEMFMVDPNR
ncbi:MAG: DEAD/DEAH box helicase family protein [Caldilineaceae bacterium]|nr:DEAD/DEAH box helicase family protein [Caldilineaceae bacterium]